MAHTGPGGWAIRFPFSAIFKILYYLYMLIDFPIRLSLNLLIGSWPPHPQWTFLQTILAYLVKEVVNVSSLVQSPQQLSLAPGSEKERFQVFKPADWQFYKPPLDQGASPELVGGTWYPGTLSAPTELSPSTTVLLHFHGGAFITGTGREENLGFLCTTLLKYGGATAIFAPQYRLSARPGSHCFPAALQDAVGSYLYLVQTLGVPASNIVISGDSAGGNIVIGLLRYFANHAEALQIPLPSKAVLISPWVAPKSANGPAILTTSNPHYASDFLPHSHLHWGARAYAGNTSLEDPYVSPLGHPFCTRVPMLVTVGTAEIFEPDITSWAKEMAHLNGNTIKLLYEENALHDTLLMGHILGWKRSAETLAASIGVFLRE